MERSQLQVAVAAEVERRRALLPLAQHEALLQLAVAAVDVSLLWPRLRTLSGL